MFRIEPDLKMHVQNLGFHFPSPKMWHQNCYFRAILRPHIRLNETTFETKRVTKETLLRGSPLQGGPKMAPFLYALTLPHINRFSQLFSLSESGENF